MNTIYFAFPHLRFYFAQSHLILVCRAYAKMSPDLVEKSLHESPVFNLGVQIHYIQAQNCKALGIAGMLRLTLTHYALINWAGRLPRKTH